MATALLGVDAPQHLSPEETARELARCAADPTYFISTYGTILVQQPNGSREVQPFVLWDYQAKLVTALAQGGHFMILKARQLGCTTVMCAYALWVALFKPHSYILLLSKAKNEAVKLLRRVKETYRKLPDWFRMACAIGDIDNTLAMSFANGTLIEAMASTEGAGRSDTATLVLMDEADFMDDLEATYSAVRPTVDGGGQLVVMSTSDGPMSFFAGLWEDAVAHINDLRAVFFPWHVRPDRTPDWYEKKKRGYPEHRLRREYPSIWQDAFTSAEALVFPSFSASVHMEEMAYDPKVRTITCKRYGVYHVGYFIGGQDWNLSQPGALVIGAICTDGTIIIVDGWHQEGVPVTSEDPDALTWAVIARKMHAQYPLAKIWCDHQPEGIMAFQRAGLPAVKAIKDVDTGLAVMTAALAVRAETGKPGLIYNRRLDFVPKEMYAYMRRKVNGIVTDLVVKQFDHHIDATRYLCMGASRGIAKISLI